MLLKIFIFLFAVCHTAWCQRGCSRDRMRQCDETLLRSIQRRINDMGRSDMAAHCMNVREDFNCLLRETRCLTSETDRNRNGDTLRNALKYIRDGCDSAGASWRDSSCYVGDPMKTCESSYPLGGVQYASHNPETCRKYNLFYDCVMDTIRNRCRPEDERLLGQYLVDSAQDLAWNCGEQTSTSDWDRNNRDDRRYESGDRRYGGAAGDRYSDRERDGYNRAGGSSGYGRDRYDSRDRDTYDRYGGSGRDTYNPSGGVGGYGRNGSSDITCCRNERCDRYRQQQCRDSLSRTIDNRMAGYQDSQKCRKTRDDFNCLMWQTSNCLNREERDRDNDIFRRARDFISRNCDTYGRWTENNCYKTTEMQRCEALVSNTRGGANYESCRGFLSFRDCMSDELMRRCTREDDLYQGAYLVDKAQEMSWQCGTTDQYNGRNQYSTFDRKYDQYDRPQDNYDNNNSPLHLEDEDAMCLSRAQTYTDQCKTNMEEKRRELYTENDFERRQRINCCSIREYRNCLFDATRRYCQTERSRVVDSLMAGYRHQLSSDSCVRVYDSECSAGHQSAASFVLLVTCLALFSALVSFRR
ncbi:uncharacterized protein TNIN_337272 [Trichonephila inaurata madagascariensis]|uniref:Uncharacterized protein n=1 Tax=Trichonephila inaurata madagascariensis TaxID=2747483 RepID=A0A8X7C3Q4_9ARAC|nr:uncharacterized protein TNIN_337272 [Trichonephila inaurata madagascariensis]